MRHCNRNIPCRFNVGEMHTKTTKASSSIRTTMSSVLYDWLTRTSASQRTTEGSSTDSYLWWFSFDKLCTGLVRQFKLEHHYEAWEWRYFCTIYNTFASCNRFLIHCYCFWIQDQKLNTEVSSILCEWWCANFMFLSFGIGFLSRYLILIK